MSSTASFQSIAYFGSDSISIFSSGSKGWKHVETVDFSGKVSKKAEKLLQKSVLVLVSDAYNGHVQIVFPNKKSELTDEKIASVLEKEYEIDTSAYEFASQKFTLSREQVQLSISGVEREMYTKIETWLAQFSSKKAWVMPFGWFVSALKSVEPVLLAVALSESEILVSHHYLGVDDARAIEISDLEAYVKARKGERKETHLLYVQADESVMKKVSAAVDDIVATHPLLADADGENVLLDIISAVWKKGEEAIADLMHFEVDVPEGESKVAAAPAPVEDKTEETEEMTSKKSEESAETDTEDVDEVETEETTEEAPDMATEVEVVPASDLPKPNIPDLEESTESGTTVEVEESEAVETEDVPETSEETKESKKVEEEKAKPVSKAKEPVVEEAEEPEEKEAAVEETPEKEVEESTPEISEKPAFADLQSSAGMARASESRYVEVPKKSSWKVAFFVFFVVVVLTSLIGGAVFWSQQSVEVQQPLLPETSPTPTPLIEAEPEATEEAEVAGILSEEEKADLSVLVLNATGIAGLAGDTRSALQDAGWDNIDVGNASGSYDGAMFVYTENEQVIATLEEDLDTEVTATNEVTESGSDDYDVVFIIADEVSW